MKFVLAPDSFKGTIRSPEVCDILAEAICEVIPEAECVKVPLADGGEGSLDAVAVSGGEIRTVTVQDPLGRLVQARYLAWPGQRRAMVEMAEASGLELLRPEERHPLQTSTYGTGQLLDAARREGALDIIVAIGGSATVDGGLGMALALGAKALDKDGLEVKPCGASLADICEIRLGSILDNWRGVKVRIASDVTNPLLGVKGAAAVFGPQKGATPAEVEKLERGLANWADCLKRSGLCQDCEHPGDGAAGGLGFALRVLLGGAAQSGAKLIAELLELPEKLRGADFLITGEGRTDSQTAFGKLPAVVAEIAKSAGVPAILLSGSLETGADLGGNFLATFATVTESLPLEQILASARPNLKRQAKNLATILKLAGRK
jgi:glycerate kinase